MGPSPGKMQRNELAPHEPHRQPGGKMEELTVETMLQAIWDLERMSAVPRGLLDQLTCKETLYRPAKKSPRGSATK